MYKEGLTFENRYSFPTEQPKYGRLDFPAELKTFIQDHDRIRLHVENLRYFIDCLPPIPSVVSLTTYGSWVTHDATAFLLGANRLEYLDISCSSYLRWDDWFTDQPCRLSAPIKRLKTTGANLVSPWILNMWNFSG